MSPSTPTLTLVLGGARSGKSAWAERVAARSGRPVLYLATATVGDAEMADRVAAHRAARPPHWRAVEEPIDLPGIVQRVVTPGDLLLVDCLTLWVSNLILAHLGARDPDDLPRSESTQIEAWVLGLADDLLAAIRNREAEAILVSNEVGLGLVPPYPLGRLYRDVLGRVNQRVAATADSVVLMVAGLPIDLQRFSLEGIRSPSRPPG